jgi:ADP-ribosyl-[dinitrogen reductase] hydrolase
MNKIERNYLKDLLYGFCVGDALGVPVEFESREYLKKNPVTKMGSGGVHDQGIGVWSDDSSLTFCLAESIIEGYDIHRLSNKFIKWKNEGFWTATGEVFDIGNTTRQSIINLSKGVHPRLAGGLNEIDNGNGSLMRILPLVILLKDLPIEKRFDLVKEVSSITHSHNRSVISCFYYLEFALQIMEGNDKFEIYENLKISISNFLNSNEIYSNELIHFDRLLNGNIYELEEELIQSGGYVIQTLEASIWCLLTTNNYEEAVLKAVNLGGDTDTTGAVTGGLAGLIYGFETIPKTWVVSIRKRNKINKLIHSHHKQVSSLSGKMIVNYKITTRDYTEENGVFKDDSAILFDAVPHQLEAILHLTNEDGVNSISLNFNYPNYPNAGFVSCELESEITCSNENFNFLLDFSEIIFINENAALLKGSLAVNLFDSNDVDNFKYELLIKQDNCKEIIQNSTINPIYHFFDEEEY